MNGARDNNLQNRNKNYFRCENILRRRFINPTPIKRANADIPYTPKETGIIKVN